MIWLRRLLYGLGALAVLLALAGGGGYLWLRGSLPQTTGEIAVPRLGAEVEVRRDGDGIATIRARSEADAFYALGFVHAQDRLFQMDLMRRVTAGRLSEVMGEATADVDRMMRILGLYRLAEANLATLPNDMRVILEAYAAGVNAFLDRRVGPLPPEFQLLGYAPEPWRPADSLAWGKLMALQLSDNWWQERLRYRLSGVLTPAQLNELWPAPPAPDIGVPQAERPEDRAAHAPTFLPVAGQEELKGASNSFVVVGSRSASGKPLLANDPHLGLQAPIQWYLARLETPTLTLAGATAPGVPLMVIGHNGHVAWTFTTTHSDTQDLYLEKLLPGDPTHYLAPSGPAAFDSRDETIKIDGQDDLVIRVRTSRHGPVVSDAPQMKWKDAEQVLALAWPGLNADDGTAAALFRINRARDHRELLTALRDFDSPQQNVVFADVAGRIGFAAAGRMPIRYKRSANSEMPAPGWVADYDWHGFYDLAEMPQSQDPPRGWIATANNDIRPEDYGRFLGARWDAPFRYNRIAELIEATPKHTAETLAAIQVDSLSLAAPELVGNLIGTVEATDPASAQAKALLEAWDSRMNRDRPEPLIFTAWLAELNKSVLSDELGGLFEDFAAWNSLEAVNLVMAGSSWCDDIRVDGPQSCKTQVNQAWHDAIAKLTDAYGADPGTWRWGAAHQARFQHPIFSRIPVLRDLLENAVAADGDNFTVNRATPRLDFETVQFDDVHGAGLRAVFDLADLDRSRFIIAGGQSGHPLSPHYGDMVGRWRDGLYLTILGEGSDLLTLVPAGQGGTP